MNLPTKLEREEWKYDGVCDYKETILRLLALADELERQIAAAESVAVNVCNEITAMRVRIEKAKAVEHSFFCNKDDKHGLTCDCPMREVITILEGATHETHP